MKSFKEHFLLNKTLNLSFDRRGFRVIRMIMRCKRIGEKTQSLPNDLCLVSNWNKRQWTGQDTPLGFPYRGKQDLSPSQTFPILPFTFLLRLSPGSIVKLSVHRLDLSDP